MKTTNGKIERFCIKIDDHRVNYAEFKYIPKAGHNQFSTVHLDQQIQNKNHQKSDKNAHLLENTLHIQETVKNLPAVGSDL